MSSPRNPSRVSGSGSNLNETPSRSSSAQASSGLMNGVNGDMKEAFGKSPEQKMPQEGQDLRMDLLVTVDEVTDVMKNVVSELTEGWCLK